MADVTYDFAWVTKFRYDSLTAGESGIIPRLRTLVAPIVVKWGGILLGQIRVDDYMHCRVRIDDNVSRKGLLKDIKGQISYLLQTEYPYDLKPYHYGRYMWKRNDEFIATDNPGGSAGDAVIDAWVAKRPKHALPA